MIAIITVQNDSYPKQKYSSSYAKIDEIAVKWSPNWQAQENFEKAAKIANFPLTTGN